MADRLDQALLAELRALMEDDFGTLLEAYLADSERRLLEVADAWAAGDFDALRRSAHSLKGASSNLGANELAGRCQTLEHLARDEITDAVPAAMAAVEAELREVQAVLRSVRAGC